MRRSIPAAFSPAKCPGARTVTITRKEILTALNKSGQFILATVEVVGNAPGTPRYISPPFQRRAESGVTSVEHELEDLLARAGAPS